jgi:hypothetical protein
MNKICASCLSIMLSWLLLFNAVNAAELLNLVSRAEGDKTLGENVIVSKVEQTGVKYVTGYNGLGRLQFPINLSTDFEVSFRAYVNSGTLQMMLASDESFTQVDISSYDAAGIYGYLKGTSVSDVSLDKTSWAARAINAVKLTVKDGVVKVYINDAFAGKYSLPKANLTYTKLTFQGIEADVMKLYEINASVSTIPTTPKLAGISTRGRIGTDPMDYLIAGLLVQGGTKQLIVRAVSVDGIVNPRVTVKSYPAGTVLYTNNDWTAGASAANLQQIKWNPPKTTDAAMIISLAPGLYTLEVAPEGVGGVGIVEVYEYPQ